MSKTVHIAIHDRVTYVSPLIEVFRSDGQRVGSLPPKTTRQPLQSIAISGIEHGKDVCFTATHEAPTIMRSLNGTAFVLKPRPAPDAAEVQAAAKRVQVLVDAMSNLLADIGDGHAVSAEAKAQAVAAFEPFRGEEEEDDDEGDLGFFEEWQG